MIARVYGQIDHVLNGTDYRALKKAHGIGIGDARIGIGASWRITEESVLNSLSVLSILTTIAQLFQTSEVAVSKLPRTCIFPSPSDPSVMPPDIP
jgi:hypothetical protein